jgi:transitional endoplasmic reticulum ATPase
VLDPSVPLVVRVTPSAADARRGVVRLHPEVLDALGLQSWDAVTLTGVRVTTALAAPAAPGVAPGQATVDDVLLSNAGLTDGATVVVAPAHVAAARRVLLTGSRLARAALTPETARLALLGKVVTGGDAVSLLPQDVEPVAGLDVAAARRRLAGAVGGAWTTELLTVAGTDPGGAVAVVPSTVVGWQGDGAWGSAAGGSGAREASPVGAVTGPAAAGESL